MQPSSIPGLEAPVGGSLGAVLGRALGVFAAVADIAGKGSYAVVVTGLGVGLGRRRAVLRPTAVAPSHW